MRHFYFFAPKLTFSSLSLLFIILTGEQSQGLSSQAQHHTHAQVQLQLILPLRRTWGQCYKRSAIVNYYYRPVLSKKSLRFSQAHHSHVQFQLISALRRTWSQCHKVFKKKWQDPKLSFNKKFLESILQLFFGGINQGYLSLGYFYLIVMRPGILQS